MVYDLVSTTSGAFVAGDFRINQNGMELFHCVCVLLVYVMMCALLVCECCMYVYMSCFLSMLMRACACACVGYEFGARIDSQKETHKRRNSLIYAHAQQQQQQKANQEWAAAIAATM